MNEMIDLKIMPFHVLRQNPKPWNCTIFPLLDLCVGALFLGVGLQLIEG